MSFNTQVGKSFLEIFGVLIGLAVVAGLGFSKYTQDSHHQSMLKIVETMHTFFEKYSVQAPDIFKQSSVTNGAAFIKSYQLMDDCKDVPSFFNQYNRVCAFDLGEVDVKTEVSVDKVHTEVFVHFLDMYKKHSCRQFLAVGWQKVLPKGWWKAQSYIGVVSENTNGKMYFSHNSEYIRNDGAQENPTPQHLKNVCDTCKGSRYCSILFSFTLDDDVLKNVTFPAEFVGAKEKTDDKDAKVTKNGSTYTKTTGNRKEVVTFSNNTFKGTTYSGGHVTGSYRGTYSPRGITSYASYNAPGNKIREINNIKYGKDGKVQSYDQGTKKIFLTGNAHDCLIMDNISNAKKFANCADLFHDEKSSMLLQYDNKGRLNQIVLDGADKKAYTFAYNEYTGELTDYCEEDGKKCHKVAKGKTLKDIIHRDVPMNVEKFDPLWKTEQKNGSGRRPVLTKEELLKRVKDQGNKVKIIMK